MNDHRFFIFRQASKASTHKTFFRRLPLRSQQELLEERRFLAAHIVGSSASYATIQAAVDAAVSGAKITVDAGTYSEKVTITKSLTISGAQAGVDARQASRGNGTGAGDSIVTGARSGSVSSTSFYINANDVTIDGFTVQGETDQSLTSGAGMVIAPNRFGTHVINNIVQNNVSGLFLANNSTTDPAVIQYNVFRNNNNDGTNGGRGIYTNQSVFGATLTNVTIDANTFTNNYGGSGTTNLEAAVALESTASGRVTNIRLTNNSMSGNGKGLLAYNASNLLVKGNTITTTQDQYSGTLRFEGNVQNVTIQYNNIFNNTGPAVAVDSKATEGDSSGFVVNSNNFYGNNAAYSVPISVVFDAKVYPGVFDARNNWWGNASGPSGAGTGTGDAVSAGAFQPGTGLGWKLLPGGSLLFSPWSTTFNVQPGLLPTAPNGFTAIASGLTQVTLNWSDTAPGVSTGFSIERSTDGVTFTPIATTSAGVTRYVDTAAAAGTAYTYHVAATNSNGSSPFSAAAGDTTPAVGSTATNISTLNWVSATTGYSSVQKNLSVAGRPLTLNGVVYSTGLGTHAVSNIVYNLAGGYSNFISDIGVDAEENGKGTGHVIFQVIGDGKILYDSGVLMNPAAPVSINVNVAGVQTLTLVATNGVAGNIDYDHSDWAGAKLIAPAVAPTVPASPSGLSAVALSSSRVNLSWLNNATNATGVVIQRSLDGITFTPLATAAANVTSYSDLSVAGGTTYVYRVSAVNAVGTSTFSAAASATTPAANAITTYLSDLSWLSATTGYGTIHKNQSVGGNTLKLGTTTYTKGIGTHAVSTIVYNLNKVYTSFVSDVGVDAEEYTKGTGSIIFRVVGDNGVVLFDSGVLTNSSPPLTISVDVTGVSTLTLIATNGVAGNIDYDHADWANARLLSLPSTLGAGSAKAASIVSSATPTEGRLSVASLTPAKVAATATTVATRATLDLTAAPKNDGLIVNV